MGNIEIYLKINTPIKKTEFMRQRRIFLQHYCPLSHIASLNFLPSKPVAQENPRNDMYRKHTIHLN